MASESIYKPAFAKEEYGQKLVTMATEFWWIFAIRDSRKSLSSSKIQYTFVFVFADVCVCAHACVGVCGCYYWVYVCEHVCVCRW